MRLLRYLQHWLTGTGRPLRVADIVPESHPIRQWADPFPWTALVAAVDRNFAQRFPTPTARGRVPVATRVLLALELLKHELHCSDEQICSQLRTDLSQDYFRFMFADGVEPTNNHSEQQIRHCVIDRRITQGTRGAAGQRYHERMWTAIATCRKQNRNFFSFLHASIKAHLEKQPAPSLLRA